MTELALGCELQPIEVPPLPMPPAELLAAALQVCEIDPLERLAAVAELGNGRDIFYEDPCRL